MSGVLKRGLSQGLRTVWTLGKVIFPITLIITILQFTPVFPWVMRMIEPLMQIIGLSGEAAVPLVLGNALNLYAGIAAILTFEFTVKEVFILAMMLSFSHNLFVESAVASRVGVNWFLIVGIRLFLATVSAFLINLFWQGGSELAQYGFVSAEVIQPNGVGEIIFHGIETAGLGVIQLAIIVIPLMIIMQVLRESGWMERLSRMLAPFLRFLGMKENTSMTMVSGLTIGLAYGAGMMIQAKNEDGVSNKDMHLALIFLVACHAIVEDTLIFVPLGIPVWPLFVIRLTTAIVLTMGIAFVWNRVEERKRKEKEHEHSYRTI